MNIQPQLFLYFRFNLFSHASKTSSIFSEAIKNTLANSLNPEKPRPNLGHLKHDIYRFYDI